MASAVTPLRIRGHHLLCLHGFRGLGYSPEFVANMQAVKDRLLDPTLEVEVTVSPDDICAACPHLAAGGCSRKGDSEARISAKDSAVLRRLSLSAGDHLPAGTLFALVAERFSRQSRDPVAGQAGISGLCSSCKWYPLGWCEAGIRKSNLGSASPGT